MKIDIWLKSKFDEKLKKFNPAQAIIYKLSTPQTKHVW